MVLNLVQFGLWRWFAIVSFLRCPFFSPATAHGRSKVAPLDDNPVEMYILWTIDDDLVELFLGSIADDLYTQLYSSIADDAPQH